MHQDSPNEGNINVVLPTSYWGSILYFSILYFEKCGITNCENYQKKSIRNRAIVLGPNGKTMLSIPLTKGKNHQLPIDNVTIFNQESWVNDHLKTLSACYGKSPYYDFYIDEITALYTDTTMLFDFNFKIIQWVCRRFLDINPKILSKNEFTPSFTLSDYDFLGSDVKLRKYHQVFEFKYGFKNNLSILDLIFNTGPELRIYLDRIPMNSLKEI